MNDVVFNYWLIFFRGSTFCRKFSVLGCFMTVYTCLCGKLETFASLPYCSIMGCMLA